ncbi:MAG TPA: glycosyltransferase family 2 protein [Ignavibacteriaceae bacterium]|nr:glycosyltransferase family 2 protein [Ignavibacteriaceae bacterium]
MKTAIILPAYNEELTIEKTILDFHQYSQEADIYVIDNNSSDKTNEIAKKVLKENNIKGEVIFVKRQGKANAMNTAFSRINADIYVMADADHTYFGHDLEKLLPPVASGEYDLVVGNRFTDSGYEKENKRMFHNFGNNLVKKIINLLFKANLKDIMSGYRVLSKNFVKNYPIMCEGFEIETEMTLHCLDKRFNIIEIPITYKDRIEGSFSKLNTFKDGFRVLKTIFNIFKDYRPMLFFSILSVIFFIAGVLLGIDPVMEFIEFQYVYKVPSAILATGLMIFSLLFFAIGLILDTIVRYEKFNFEMRKNNEGKL